MYYLRKIICIIVFVSVKAIFAVPLNYDKQTESYKLGPYFEFYEDKNNLSIEEIIKSKDNFSWQIDGRDTPNFGYSKSSYWARFKIDFQKETTEPVSLFLEYAYPPTDNIEFYFPDKNGSYIKKVSGDRKAFSERDIKYRYYVFEFSSLPGQIAEYYIKVTTTSSVQLPVTLWSTVGFMETKTTDMFINGLYYGFLIIMILYNLILFFSVKDRSYLFYVFFISSFILFEAGLSGMGMQYLWPESPKWNDLSIPFLILTPLATAILFTRSYLVVSYFMPKWHKITNYIIGVFFLFAFISFMMPYRVSIILAIVMAILTSPLLLFLGFRSYKLKYHPSRFYLLAWGGLLTGIVLYALKSLGTLPANFITNNAIPLGATAQVILLSLGLGDKINFERKEREEQITRTNKAYSRFVPMQFLQFLNKKSIIDVELGDQVEKYMTVMFVDIRSFATLSESMTPEENFNFLNSYLKRISPIIRKNNGFIDKYIGDAVMALFPESPAQALTAAEEIFVMLRRYNKIRERQGYNPIDIGIGIHTGSLILGTIGEKERLEGTVISDSVNIASRLESLTKKFGCHIIVSDDIIAACHEDESHIRLLGNVRVKGRTLPLAIYDVFTSERDDIKQEKLANKEVFETAINLYYSRKFDEAAAVFNKIKSESKINDKAIELYLDKISRIDKTVGSGLGA
ncbi:MAG: guanylate cyclase [Spirochaetia bacterium]|nr:guanylate cyclase [Spirochaetia bacterium]